MPTVTFLYRSTKPKAALTLRIFYRLTNTNKFIEAKTSVTVTKTYWLHIHNKKQISTSTLALKQSQITLELMQIKQRVFKSLNHLPITKINNAMLIAIINNTLLDNSLKPDTLKESITHYIKYRATELKKNTIKRYNFVKNSVIEYENYTKTNLHLVNVDYNFKAGYTAFCIENKYAPNSIKRNIAAIKTVCFYAELQGKQVNTSFKNWKTSVSKSNTLQKPIYFSFIELNRIEQLSLTCNYEITARDWLVISCYKGQRFSDFMAFTNQAIYKENGKYYMAFTQQKTNKKMVIALHKKVILILQKRNMQFPRVMSLAYYNSLLKTICKTAAINTQTYGAVRCKTTHKNKLGFYPKWQLVSSHVGRRSFASNYYGKIPTSLLKSATGHSTEKMLLQYIGKTDAEQAKQIHSYFE